jgi:hypothetical protein
MAACTSIVATTLATSQHIANPMRAVLFGCNALHRRAG